MAITQTWKINRLDVRPQLGNLTGVVSTIQWEIITQDEGNPSVTPHSANGLVTLPTPSSQDGFVPFEQLTENQVVAWAKNTLGSDKVAEVENYALAFVAEQISPAEPVLQMPWASA